MSNPINDGGAAFPWQLHIAAGSFNPIRNEVAKTPTVEVMAGMTLRDYFAAQALPQLVRTALDLDHAVWDATAQHAYLIADAMIKERTK